MAGRTPWLQRSWAFDDVPPDEVLARLRTAPDRAAAAFQGVSTNTQTRRVDGTWSMRTNLGHLADLEQLVQARVDDFVAQRSELSPWTGNEETDITAHEERTAEELCAAFRSVRAQTMTRLDALEASAFAREALHPRLGRPMRLIDLCVFHAEHDDHHIARLRELAGYDGAHSKGADR